MTIKLTAHAHNNMGIRTSSMGEHYPYIVVAKGNPHVGVRWHIQHANGSISNASWDTSAGASAMARHWKYIDELEAVKL